MTDPCDHMVSVRQAMDFVSHRPLPAGTKKPDVYDRIALILDMPREKARAAVFATCYGASENRARSIAR